MGDIPTDFTNASGGTEAAIPSFGGGSAAGGLSLASLGFKLAGDSMSANATASADTYKSELLDRAAQYGDLKATQVGGQMTRNLTMTLGHLDAIRAAQRTDPTSPTGAAVRDFVETTGTEQKDIRVDSILAQAQEDTANAAYLRDASSKALLSGDIKMAGDVVGALGPLAAL